jgi:outer membrane biogenesis lipoprotein LolB
MKTNIRQLLIIGASIFLLAGCCTTHHVTRWEYKVVPMVTGDGPEWQKTQEAKEEALMNDLGKEGWIFVSRSAPFSYFKRLVK